MDEKEARERFEEALEMLKQVHTREELEKVRKEVYKRRDELFKVSPSDKIQMELRRNRINRGDYQSRFDEIRREADGLRRKAEMNTRMFMNPHMREIQEVFMRDAVKIGLTCPECGDPDHGNKKNKRSWCLKCDVPLVNQKRMERWGKGKIKVVK